MDEIEALIATLGPEAAQIRADLALMRAALARKDALFAQMGVQAIRLQRLLATPPCAAHPSSLKKTCDSEKPNSGRPAPPRRSAR